MAYLGVFLLAVAVRAVYLAEWHDTALFSVLLGDGRAYDLWAREIAGGNFQAAICTKLLTSGQSPKLDVPPGTPAYFGSTRASRSRHSSFTKIAHLR